ncbi:MAG TPA: DEAD/DEAH box helicase family protein [Rubricoccaceae bacterium]
MSSPTLPPEVASDATIPGLALRDGFALRDGQTAFLRAWAAALDGGERNALGVFVPGYGKTITALASFLVARALGIADRLVVFVPRGNLRDQYADGAELARVFQNLGAPPVSFCVADSDRVFLKNLDVEVVITTYQYASGERGNDALIAFCRQAKALFVFDEVHHLATDGTWARAVERFPHAASVALSGTPLRSDNKTLFGVPFEEDDDGFQYYRALHEVSMRQAHAEGGILKRVDAHVVDYTVRMVRTDTGEEVDVSLSELREMADTPRDVDTFLARRKLRFHEVYLDTLLGPAFARFAEKRGALARTFARTGRLMDPAARNHQMLVIAMSNIHAAAILQHVRRRYPDISSARIGQDVPAQERQTTLDAYRRGEIDVMVQVDMIGEGTDIKPISVLVKADLVRALGKTMQQVFRGMRHVPGWPDDANRCDLYAADDSGVVDTLRWIAAEEQAGVKRSGKSGGEGLAVPGTREVQHSVWELKSVTQGASQTTSIEQMPGYRTSAAFHAAPPVPEAAPEALDVARRERALRRECAVLARDLAFALDAPARPVTARDVHRIAKERIAKAQGDLSLGELERKKLWLERSIRAGRLQ